MIFVLCDSLPVVRECDLGEASKAVVFMHAYHCWNYQWLSSAIVRITCSFNY